MQIGGEWIGNIIWFALLFVMFYFYPRILLYQILSQLEQKALMVEGLMKNGRNIVIKKVSRKGKDVREAVTNFLDFFVIEPVSLDPYGIVKKIEHMVELQEKRFKYFVKTIAPHLEEEEQANVMMGLSGAVSLNQIAKLIRHYVEIIKKTKNYQLGMIFQMQMPMVERLSKALLKGTEALTNGWPIGDSVGALVAAHLFENSKPKEIVEDTLIANRTMGGRKVIIIKAKGPGGRLGNLDKAIEKISKRTKIAKIITIDAAAKLEGERTGSVAEGVGVALGGVGVERTHIENISTERQIPLDSIIVKMLPEEAIMPMMMEILNSVDRVMRALDASIERTKEKGTIVVIGVGNTTGIGNDKKAALKAEEEIRKNISTLKKRGDYKEMEKGTSYSPIGGIGINLRRVFARTAPQYRRL